jgi:hypothetical protein
MRFAVLAAALVLAAAGAAAAPAPAAGSRTVTCRDVVGPTRPRFAHPWQMALESAAIRNIAPKPTRVKSGSWRFRSPTGIIVRGYAPPLLVSVAPGWRGRAAIALGRVAPGVAVRIATCRAANDGKAWNAYRGALYVRAHRDCVPLVFRMGNRVQTLRVGVGAPCPE